MVESKVSHLQRGQAGPAAQWGKEITINDFALVGTPEEIDTSGCWSRPEDEYKVTGNNFVALCDHFRARKIDAERIKAYDDRGFNVFAVRGVVFNAFQIGLFDSPRCRGEVWFELIPEPHNPADPRAVAIDFRGVRVGYVHADLAMWIHGLVLSANLHNKRCVVPGFICSSQSAWYAIDDFPRLEEFVQYNDIVSRIVDIWRHMPAREKETVGRPSFSEKAALTYWKYRDFDPGVYPSSPEPYLYWPLWYRAEKVLNPIKKSYVVAVKRERSIKVISLYGEGKKKSEISRRLGISVYSVEKIIKDSALKKSL